MTYLPNFIVQKLQLIDQQAAPAHHCPSWTLANILKTNFDPSFFLLIIMIICPSYLWNPGCALVIVDAIFFIFLKKLNLLTYCLNLS